MKRFWRDTTVEPEAGGFAVALDRRPVRTPKGRPLIVPTAALAEALATEWERQGATVEPLTMPLSRLATSVIDLMPGRRQAALDQALGFAMTDLLCYRASEPMALAESYRRHWDPPLAWMQRTLGSRLVVTEGVMPQLQPASAVDAVAQALARLDDWRLVGAHAVATVTGSVVLALMVEAGALDGTAAADAALVEERFQRERWGDEIEALRREARLVNEVTAADRYLRALR